MQTTEATLIEIKKAVRVRMDGATAALMRHRGASECDYIMGLSIPQIRDLAKLYIPSEELSSELLKHKVRELRLLGILLFPQDKLGVQQLTSLLSKVASREEAELLSYHLIAPSESFDSLIDTLLGSNIPFASEAAYNALARRALLKMPIKRSILERALIRIENDPELHESSMHFLVRLREYTELKELMSEHVKQWAISEKETLRRLSNVLLEVVD